jgi:hypothetical protein
MNEYSPHPLKEFLKKIYIKTIFFHVVKRIKQYPSFNLV